VTFGFGFVQWVAGSTLPGWISESTNATTDSLAGCPAAMALLCYGGLRFVLRPGHTIEPREYRPPRPELSTVAAIVFTGGR
jgi:hypothetical protein